LKDPSHSDGAGMAGNRSKTPTEEHPRPRRAESWLITHSPICSLMLVERYPYRSGIKAFHTHA
jgi:hypothetical protein